MHQKSPKEIEALLTLLTDSDVHTVEMAKEKLKDLEPASIASLKKAANAKGPRVWNQIGSILNEVERSEECEKFAAYLSQTEEIDLEEGSFLLAKTRYPKFNPNRYRSLLDRMAEELKTLTQKTNQPAEVVRHINFYLFVEQGFHGNTANYYDPENSYMNRVLDRKTGIPITLSAVYLFLARRINLPIVGVGMPTHFLIRYEGHHQKLLMDPFHGGAILRIEDCIQFLQHSGLPFHPSFLEKVSDRAILARMLKNLQSVYAKNQSQTELNQVEQWLSMIFPLEQPE